MLSMMNPKMDEQAIRNMPLQVFLSLENSFENKFCKKEKKKNIRYCIYSNTACLEILNLPWLSAVDNHSFGYIYRIYPKYLIRTPQLLSILVLKFE